MEQLELLDTFRGDVSWYDRFVNLLGNTYLCWMSTYSVTHWFHS